MTGRAGGMAGIQESLGGHLAVRDQTETALVPIKKQA
jgi:hypothetical protein